MDTVLIGGGMANTFLKARGVSVGSSKIEEDMVETAAEILSVAGKKGCFLVLPSDVVVAEKMEATAGTEVVGAGAIPEGRMALDIGPKTVSEFEKAIQGGGPLCGTALWVCLKWSLSKREPWT